MIRIYSIRKGELCETRKLTAGCWVDIIAPSGEEFKKIAVRVGIPEDILKTPLDEDERPRIEKEDGLTAIIVHIPVENIEADVPVMTIPLGIFLTRRNIVTLALHDSPVLEDFRKGLVRHFSPANMVPMVLQLLMRMNAHYLHYLRRTEREVDKLETSLLRSFKNEEVIKMLGFQKTLVYFSNSIMANAQLLDRLHRGQTFDMTAEQAEWLDDIMIENHQAQETTKIFTDILSNTMDAYASIVSNNLNMVMKFLASITIILSFPTMVASFFGMNVDLPLQKEPVAFLVTILLSFVISIGAAIIFRTKRWL